MTTRKKSGELAADDPLLKPRPKGEANPTKPVAFDVPEIIPDDDRPIQDQLVDQQWRDAKRLGLFDNHPLSINRNGPPKH